jgi:DNA-binding MarR family transcriptional regulator
LDLQYQDKYFTKKINLNIFDKLEAYDNLTPMEKLILNYIKNYGPMTIGKLVMMISYGEKISVKSKDILNACEKLVKEKKLIREGYGPLTSKYYLST